MTARLFACPIPCAGSRPSGEQRGRGSPTKRAVIAVTGSAGKTGTKEMLRALPVKARRDARGRQVVQQSLGRAADAGAHAGLERASACSRSARTTPARSRRSPRMVRPHVAIITTVEPVHLAQFNSVEDIAAAKAEIFLGLEPGGVAMLELRQRAFRVFSPARAAVGAKVRFRSASTRAADVAAARRSSSSRGLGGRGRESAGARSPIASRSPGAHRARTRSRWRATLSSLGVDAATALSGFDGSSRRHAGRGARAARAVAGGTALLIDESYNANPASCGRRSPCSARVPRQRLPAPHRRHGRHAGARVRGIGAACRPQGCC